MAKKRRRMSGLGATGVGGGTSLATHTTEELLNGIVGCSAGFADICDRFLMRAHDKEKEKDCSDVCYCDERIRELVNEIKSRLGVAKATRAKMFRRMLTNDQPAEN